MNDERKQYFYGRAFVIAAAGLGLGIAAGRILVGPAAYWAAGLLTLAAALCFFARIPRATLLLFTFAIGLLRLQLAYPMLPQPADACELTGRIVQTPIRQTASWRVVLDRALKDGYPIDGRVSLTLPDAAGLLNPQYGQTLRATASLSLPTGARNEGGLDLRFYYFTQGISCTAFAQHGSVSLHDGRIDLYGTLLQLREQSTKRLTQMLGQQNGPLAAGVLHGETSGISDTILSDFRDSGISHLLSVSGLHVSLLAGVASWSLRRCREGVQFGAIAVFALLYSAFTAFSAPAVRAALMAVTLQLSHVLWRRNDPLSSLSLSFLLILLVSPFSLFLAGFQLSFGAMLGIFLVYPPLLNAFSALPRPIAESLALSFAASAGTLPATAAHFNRMPLLAVIANLLITPLAALSLLPSIAALLLYPLLPALATGVAQIAGITLTLIRAVAYAASRPGVLQIVSPTFGAAALFFGSLLFISPYCRAQRRVKGLLFGTSAALSLLLWIYPPLARPAAYVTVLDVPRGYAAHIHTQTGDALIGTIEALNGADLREYLAANGVRGYTLSICGPEGTQIQAGGREFLLSPGAVQVENIRYETQQNGQMRFYEQDGSLLAKAYADDGQYAILMEKARAAPSLEELWTITAFSNYCDPAAYPAFTCFTVRKNTSSKARCPSLSGI